MSPLCWYISPPYSPPCAEIFHLPCSCHFNAEFVQSALPRVQVEPSHVRYPKTCACRKHFSSFPRISYIGFSSHTEWMGSSCQLWISCWRQRRPKRTARLKYFTSLPVFVLRYSGVRAWSLLTGSHCSIWRISTASESSWALHPGWIPSKQLALPFSVLKRL